MTEMFLEIHHGHVRWTVSGPRNRSGSDPIDTDTTPFNELVAFGLMNAVGPHRGLTSVMIHISDDRHPV